MRYSHSTLVRAPIEEVFRFCTTRIGFCKYFPYPIYWHQGPENPGKGDIVHFQYHLLRRWWITHCVEITEFDENRCYATELVKGPYRHFSYRYHFESRGNDTLVREHVDFTMGYGAWFDHVVIMPFHHYLYAARHRMLTKLFDDPMSPARRLQRDMDVLDMQPELVSWYDVRFSHRWHEAWLALMGVRSSRV